MKIMTAGIDLAKNVFQVHCIDERGKAVLRKQVKRDQMAPFFANLSACLIGMEACGSAHHWARKLESFGHTVRLIAPQFVKPYVKRRNPTLTMKIASGKYGHKAADQHFSAKHLMDCICFRAASAYWHIHHEIPMPKN